MFHRKQAARTATARRRFDRLVVALLAVMLTLMLALWLTAVAAFAQSAQPRTVSFPSADGKTMLTGYLFAPAGKPKTAPAIVLMHGREGAYLPGAKGNYSSMTLDKDLRNWAELWSSQGYWALIVDSFGPRGLAAGLPPRASDAGRAAAQSADRLRPLDAYGALRYLRASPRVKADRIAIAGWSNGASAALAAMDKAALPAAEAATGKGFRGALAFYPGCGANSGGAYRPYAPVRIFFGGRDNGAAIAACQKLVVAGKAAGGDIGVTVLGTASRDFDDPVRRRQDADADEAATAEARRQASALMASLLGQ
jgi:carboxymethylenebutenolidase